MIGMIVCSILITISLNISNPEKNDVDPDCNKTETKNCNNEGDSEVTTDGNGIFAIISTLAFVMFFAFGPGSIPWLITGELFTQGTIIMYLIIVKSFVKMNFTNFFPVEDEKNLEIIQFHIPI